MNSSAGALLAARRKQPAALLSNKGPERIEVDVCSHSSQTFFLKIMARHYLVSLIIDVCILDFNVILVQQFIGNVRVVSIHSIPSQ